MAKKINYVRATSEGRLYIKTVDFFKEEKVQRMVADLINSDIYKKIEERKVKNEGVDNRDKEHRPA
jgi:hypothetical protein